MTPLRSGLLFLVCLLVPTAAAQEKPGAALDRHGDPLPADALARLGPSRLRHGHLVSAVAFTPDRKRVVSAANDGTIRVWDTGNGAELLRLTSPERAHTGVLSTLALAPDGKLLAMPTAGKLHLWDLDSGKELPAWDVPGDDGSLEVCFAPDGKSLALTGNVNSVVRLWDVAGRKETRQFKTRRGASAPAFSTDGRRLAVGDGAVIRVWELATGKEQRLTRHNGPVYSIAFSPDGSLLASSGEDNTVRVWDLATGKQLRQMGHPNTRPASAHFVIDSGTVVGTAVTFTPDGKSLISCVKGDRLIRQWEVASGRQLQAFEGYPDGSLCLALSANGALLAAGAEDSSVRLWDVATGKELSPADGHRGRVFTVAAAPDGKTVFSAGRDNGVRVWDVATSRTLRHFGEDADRMGFVAFSSDGKVMASARMDDEMIQLWDLAAAKPLRELELPKSSAGSVAFSGDGKVLAAIIEDEDEVYQWDVASGKLLRQWKALPTSDEQVRILGGLKTLAFSGDGKLLATIFGGQQVCLWDAATGKLLRKIDLEPEQAGNVFRVLLSPDGRTLALLSRDNSLSLCSAETGQKLHRLTDLGLMHPQGMLNFSATAFSPDSKLVAAAGTNGDVLVWEVATGSAVRRLLTDLGWVSAVAFGPDSRTVIAGGLNTTVLVLDVSGIRSGARPAPTEMADKDLQARWAALLGDQGEPAYRAVWELAAMPSLTVPFLQNHVKPILPPDPQRLTKLIDDLDSNVFAARQKATDELEKYGEQAEDALREAPDAKPGLEVKQRLEALLQKCSNPTQTGEQLRLLRAITVLEQAGTPEARQLLAEVAKGVSSARPTREAKAALQRLER